MGLIHLKNKRNNEIRSNQWMRRKLYIGERQQEREIHQIWEPIALGKGSCWLYKLSLCLRSTDKKCVILFVCFLPSSKGANGQKEALTSININH